MDNIENYRKIFILISEDINKEEKEKKVKNVILNYSIVNFFCLITLLGFYIANIYFINAKNDEIDFKNCTESDYTIFCTNLKNSINKFNEIKNKKENEKDFTLFLSKEFLGEILIKDSKIYSINLCYNLKDIMEKTNEIQKIKNKLFHIFRFEMNCYKIFSICNLKKLLKKEIKYKKQINDFFNNSGNYSENNFSGNMFVIFNEIKDAEDFFDKFSQDFFSEKLEFIKNLKFYICCCFMDKIKLKEFHRRKKMKVFKAPEPNDVLFENLDISFLIRFKRVVIIYCISLLITGISFIIVFILTDYQDYSNKKNWKNHYIKKYFISILITIVILVINNIFQIILGYLTKKEKHYCKTNEYLSFSVKLTIFTFVNSSLIPLFTNYARYGWRKNENLVNNMLMMFLINAFVSPLMWTFNLSYLYKKFRIYLIERKENPDEHHHKTQDELNELYVLPSMDIFYKYSYIGNTLLMSFFYIPIFPLGVPISLLGFILGYFLEKFNFINMYKRPEMLNQNICFFYIENFKVILFCYSIGCFLFMNDVFPHNKWTLSNLIIFGLLCVIPYSKIFKCDLEVKQSDIQKKNYKENKFYYDYENKNPITIRLKMKKILNMLKNEGMINEETYNKCFNKINGMNIMNFYYYNNNQEQIKKEEEKKFFEKKKTLLKKKTEKKRFNFNDEVSNFFGFEKKRK